MSRFQNIVSGSVYQRLFAARIIAPKQENNAVAISRYIADYGVGKLLPSDGAVRGCGTCPDCQDRVEQQHALLRPTRQIGSSAHLDSQLGLDFLEDIFQ